MNTTTKRILVWTPRVLCILFALFMSMFALDLFSEDYSFGETVFALLMHLMPTILVVSALLVAWQRAGIGAILFIIMAAIYLVMSRGESWLISGPLFLVGVLFLFNWMYRAQLRVQRD